MAEAIPESSDSDTTANGATNEQADSDDDEVGTKRVNITLNSTLHDELTEFASDEGMSFSALVRQGAQQFRRKRERDGVERELQPVIGELESQSEHINTLDDRVGELQRAVEAFRDELSTDDPDGETSPDVEVVAEDIRQMLEAEGPLSLSELVEKTEYPRPSVQRGIEELEKSYLIGQVDDGSGPPEWGCNG